MGIKLSRSEQMVVRTMRQLDEAFGDTYTISWEYPGRIILAHKDSEKLITLEFGGRCWVWSDFTAGRGGMFLTGNPEIVVKIMSEVA